MDEEELLKKLDETLLCERILEIRSLYEELSERQKAFTSFYGIHCKAGCGACCAHFDPDITETEAEYLAFGLISEGKDEAVLDVLDRYDEASDTCPFYDSENDEHCIIYKWRPLICRLFGAAATTDKNGAPFFRRCKWDSDMKEPSKEALACHRDIIVLMNEYGLRLDESDPDNTEHFQIPEALPRAINKVRLMIQLEEEKSDP